MKKLSLKDNFMKRLIGIGLAVFLLMIGVFNDYAKAEGDIEFQFTQDYIKCLELLKSGFEDAKAVEKAKYDNPVSLGVARIRAAESENSKLRMTHSYLDKYGSYPNSLIRDTAEYALAVYDGQIELNNAAIRGFEKLYSPEVMNNPSQYNLGEAMGNIGKLQALQEQGMEALITTTKLFTGVLISKTPGEEGKMNYLAITSEEKRTILKDVVEIFGKGIKKKELDKNSGLQTFDLCGYVIYQTLSKSFKTRDMRPKGFVENPIEMK